MKVSKVQVAVSGLRETLLRVIEGWRPDALQTEQQYRDALLKPPWAKRCPFARGPRRSQNL
jgi:hypothetical protein